MTKSNEFRDLKLCILRSTLFSFLCSSRYKVFQIHFLQFVGYNIHIFFQNFWKLINMIFEFVFNGWSTGAKNLHSISIPN